MTSSEAVPAVSATSATRAWARARLSRSLAVASRCSLRVAGFCVTAVRNTAVGSAHGPFSSPGVAAVLLTVSYCDRVTRGRDQVWLIMRWPNASSGYSLARVNPAAW